jgi:hypothetical protein
MQTGAMLDWQIFAEREWDDAVAAGLIVKPQWDDLTSIRTQSRWREWQARLAAVIAIVLVGLLVGMLYPAWRAAGMEASPLPAENPEQVAKTLDHTGDEFTALVAEEALGVRLTMVTRYFRFEVHQRDSGMVGEVAANLDARYHELRRRLGLAAPVSSLTITVAPHPLATDWRRENNRLIIASPRDLPSPATATMTETMTNLLLQPLTQMALSEALAEAPVHWRWELMVDGLRLWLRTCMATAPAIPCPGRQTTAQQAAGAAPAHRLGDLLFADADWFYGAQHAGRVEAAATLIAYIAHTYGDKKVASLLPAFGQHQGWHTLAPELFGVSATDLEEGWQEYVKR